VLNGFALSLFLLHGGRKRQVTLEGRPMWLSWDAIRKVPSESFMIPRITPRDENDSPPW
jgi:hypothetical protein